MSEMTLEEAKQFMEEHKDYPFGNMTNGRLIGLILGKEIRFSKDEEIEAKTALRDQAREIIKAARIEEERIARETKERDEEESGLTLIEAVFVSGAVKTRRNARACFGKEAVSLWICGKSRSGRIGHPEPLSDWLNTIVCVGGKHFAYINAQGIPKKMTVKK